LKAELGLGDEAVLLGAVGNVRPSKRYDVLLEAFRIVRERWPQAHLAVVGQARGELFESTLELRSSLGLEEAVHFLGFREDVARAFQGLDLFVLSSSDEGFSLSTVQAMATGLPIVATRCGGPEEILQDGVEGLLVEKNQPRELAEGILRILAMPDRGRSLGVAARERAVSGFSVDAMVGGYEALYESCLNGG
jgi:glycosyltransferase involved in cell wall biosynthesis